MASSLSLLSFILVVIFLWISSLASHTHLLFSTLFHHIDCKSNLYLITASVHEYEPNYFMALWVKRPTFWWLKLSVCFIFHANLLPSFWHYEIVSAITSSGLIWFRVSRLHLEEILVWIVRLKKTCGTGMNYPNIDTLIRYNFVASFKSCDGCSLVAVSTFFSLCRSRSIQKSGKKFGGCDICDLMNINKKSSSSALLSLWVFFFEPALGPKPSLWCQAKLIFAETRKSRFPWRKKPRGKISSSRYLQTMEISYPKYEHLCSTSSSFFLLRIFVSSC